MSRAPWVVPKPAAALPRGEQTTYDIALGWRLINPRMAELYPGNSSTLNDGAACLVLASERKAEELGAEPLARIVATGVAGVHPGFMGIGPVPAIRRALDAAGLELDEIDLIEINAAFAAQVLACARELGIDGGRLNVNGGAIALGHPLGCSGARLLTTLAWELRRRGGRYGIASLCVGVGQGLATRSSAPDHAPGRVG
jgi:acetyl-CoA acetyltransferase family protein